MSREHDFLRLSLHTFIEKDRLFFRLFSSWIFFFDPFSFIFQRNIVSCLENVQIISRYIYIYTEENLKFVIHVYWYYTLYTFVHYHELVPCVQTKASRDLSRILTINLELTLASPSIN